MAKKKNKKKNPATMKQNIQKKSSNNKPNSPTVKVEEKKVEQKNKQTENKNNNNKQNINKQTQSNKNLNNKQQQIKNKNQKTQHNNKKKHNNKQQPNKNIQNKTQTQKNNEVKVTKLDIEKLDKLEPIQEQNEKEFSITKQIKLPIIEEALKKDEEILEEETIISEKPTTKTSKTTPFEKLKNKCKELLNSCKKLKKTTNKKYNRNRQQKLSKNKISEKELYNSLNKKEQQQYRQDQLQDSELILLKYRDHKGLKKIKVFFINRIKVIKYDMSRFKKRLKYGTLKDKLLILLMLLMIAGFCCVIAFCAYVVVNAPEISEKRLYKTNSSVLYDKDGNEFARLGTENREKVNYEQLPQVLIDAIIATEDSRYFQHNGIDIARFTKAAIGQVLGHSDAGGGSTLTMQVSKNAATSVVSSGIQGIVRKFTDVYLSVFVFEQKYTKEQIIEFYVNIPYLGASSYGVEQASQTYFGKSVSELTLAEASLIAGLFQAPDAYDPFNYPEKAESRRNTVLNLMCRHGYITKEQRDNAKAIPVTSLLVERKSTANQYQGFIDTVVEEVIERTKTAANPKGDDPYNVAMKIYTTLDPKRQDVVNDISNGVTYKFANDVAQTGIAVVDKKGAIVAIGAGRNKTSARSWNFATNEKNHPGSTAKPVLDYGPAIEYLKWSTGQTILDEEMKYTGGGNIRNFDRDYEGVMTIKKALAKSRNIPALFTFQQTTHEQKLTFAENLGWTVETDGNGHILESCAIGGFDGVTPLQVAAAYATFARGGTYIEPYSFTKLEYTESRDVFEVEPKKVEAMSEETAYMINMILKYAVTSGSIGTGSVSGTDIAAKTGTSTLGDTIIKALKLKNNPINDSWEVAYSPDYAIATWYGYQNITKEHYLTSSEGGKARKQITKLLVKGILKKNSRFKKPSGVTTAEIEIGTDPLQLASEYTPSSLRSKEYFIKGTVPTETSTRFSKLENPTNLRYTATDSSVTLSWDAITTPDAINTEYLTNYFKESNAYKKWAEKSLNDRLKYNTKNIGNIGYHVYMTNANGTVDLGFTTNTTFTTNVIFDEETKFTVKSAYSIFKDNKSSGVSVNVEANGSTPLPDPEDPNQTTTKPTTQVTEPIRFSIQYIGPSCSTVDDFNSLGTAGKDKIRVTSNNEDVTNEATINYTCTDAADNEIPGCKLENGKTYKVLFTIKYKGIIRNKEITLKETC